MTPRKTIPDLVSFIRESPKTVNKLSSLGQDELLVIKLTGRSRKNLPPRSKSRGWRPLVQSIYSGLGAAEAIGVDGSLSFPLRGS